MGDEEIQVNDAAGYAQPPPQKEESENEEDYEF